MAEPALEPATDVAPGEERQSNRGRTFAIIAVVVVVVALVLWVLAHLGSVPSTVGMSQERATTLLKFSGFKTDVLSVPADDKLTGRVIVQAPAGGIYLTWWPVRVTVGSSSLASGLDGQDVSFVIDAGSNALDLPVPTSTVEVLPTDAEEMAAIYFPAITWPTLMPDVQNLSKSKATKQLKGLGLKVKTKYGPSTTDVRKGRVYFQSPAPGSDIARGQTVTVWISEGPYNVVDGPYPGWSDYPRPVTPPGD